METEDNESNLSTLKEMILDEGKLVTYITLSKDLCIHVNRSKSLLKDFIESIKQDNPKQELSVNYLISGLIDDNKAKVSVCPKDELVKMQKTFKIIFFQHIYSVCKGTSHVDPSAYVSLNKYDDFNLCSGVIRNSNCIKRSFEEINNLKSKSQEVIVDKKPILSQKKNTKEAVPKADSANNIEKSMKTESNHKEIKKEVISPQKENINKQIVSKPSAQKGIAGFFNKQNGINKKKESKPPVKVEPAIIKEENNVVEKMETDDVEVEIQVKAEVKKETKVNGNNKVLNQIKKNSKVDKKRKRVLRVSDSESEDENDPFVEEDKTINEKIHDSDDEIPPTPAVNTLKITTGIVNPRKKRKVVDKTYMSDDGYIVTKREEVYESCSDSENKEEKEPVNNSLKEEKIPSVKEKIEISPKAKASETKASKKKISPPQKGKQATLMNFFKKK
ncbi:DNA polymerase delta subunit 3-like [Colias croceus]|uniref:DNA polymerase delta subunit 3-like n=1 Tax=Colias crocea TaxID=72248 RepID=UPI001E27A9D7|nr:DNA polymerase delta subunit 3-like [Colias croceus]